MRAFVAAFKKAAGTFFSPSLSIMKKEEGWILEIFLGYLVVFSGILFIWKMLNPIETPSLNGLSAFAYICFAIIFLVQLILVRKEKNGSVLRFVFLFFYMIFCLFPFFSEAGRLSSAGWIISFPFISVYFGGFRKGLFSSCLVAFLLGWSIKNSGFEMVLHIFGAYTIVLVLTMLALKYLKEVRDACCEKDRELSRILNSQSRLVELYTHDFEQNESTDEEYRNLLDIMADVLEKKGEFFIFYRKDVLSTLLSIPQPDAVLSYILLEGISNVEIFDSENEEKEKSYHDIGEYLFVSCEVEDFFSKIESVIELRKAKKSLEFNKIQTQVNRVFSSSKDKETRESNLETLFDQYNLSEREVDIARCILKGLTNKEISLELYISVETVKTHVKNTLKKCGFSSRIELIRLFSNSPIDLM